MGENAQPPKRTSRRGLLAAAVLGYLAGTFPTAGIVSRLARRKRGAAVDLRVAGSGNPGTVNATMLLGRPWGLAVFAGDVFKGFAASALGRTLAGDSGSYLAGVTSVAGHCFPVWDRFRGGKGVATSFGAELACFPAYAPLDLAVFTATFFASKGRSTLAKPAPDRQPPALRSAFVASALFSAAAAYWWLRRKGNLWGPKPTLGLPLYALATSATIAVRLLSKRPRAAAPATAERDDQREPVLVS